MHICIWDPFGNSCKKDDSTLISVLGHPNLENSQMAFDVGSFKIGGPHTRNPMFLSP